MPKKKYTLSGALNGWTEFYAEFDTEKEAEEAAFDALYYRHYPYINVFEGNTLIKTYSLRYDGLGVA